MRAAILGFIFLLATVPAMAAPACLTRNADTIRCGAPGAMPAGWKPRAQLLWDKQISRPAERNLDRSAKMICGLALALAMIAMMPKAARTPKPDADKPE